MADPVICVLCLADTCTSEVHPVFNPVAPYGYLLSGMYLFMTDITNPDFLVWSCRTWIGLDITRFCEQRRQPSSGSAWPACPKNGKSGGSTQFAQQFEFAVTAPPLVCCVWSRKGSISNSICDRISAVEVSVAVAVAVAVTCTSGSYRCGNGGSGGSGDAGL